MQGGGVALDHEGRGVRLKWHMLRRRGADPSHLRANLETGLARGAVVEVDLRFSADGDGVCLHDDTLEAETTGAGVAREHTTRELRAMRQRSGDGGALPDPPLFLEDVAAAVERAGTGSGRVQLDLKAEAGDVDARVMERLHVLLRHRPEAYTIGGEDWPLVCRLAADLPGIRLGYEPLPLFRHDPPREPAGFRDLAERILRTAPRAQIVYLHAGLVLAGLAVGESLVGRMRDAGREVDCWTVDPDRIRAASALARLVAAGSDQITTNAPEALEGLWRDRES